jgi:hypothetical protein
VSFLRGRFQHAGTLCFAAQTGHTESTVLLALVFDGDILGLSKGDITATWLTPTLGAITVQDITAEGAGKYILTLDGVTASGTITVSVSKTGYAFSPSSKTVPCNNTYSGPSVVNPNSPASK